MLNLLSKIFGSKSARDIKHIHPIVEKIKVEYAKLEDISNDELRGKTLYFKQVIADYLSAIDTEVAEIKAEADQDDVDMSVKNTLYEKVDKLEKERDTKLEEVLMQILPEAFAVVKETARRFTENAVLEVTASDFDRDLAALKPHIEIKDDKAYWKNTWTAAGV